MANEDKKDFNAMMNNNKDMPKIVHMDDPKAIEKWGGSSMIIAPPLYYDALMKKVPEGKVILASEIRNHIAKENNVDLTCPLTAGIFINICAWASHQREKDITPYWRVLRTNGELNPKYPDGVEDQKKKLESEGHEIYKKGTKNIKYFVKDYDKKIFELD